MRHVIGLDFDNTIICYDDIMYKIASERGLVGPEVRKEKKHIRDAVRSIPDGELHWQRLQAGVYGERILEAEPVEGVKDFLRLCGEEGLKAYIVSHKTQYASQDESGTDLRDAALGWMRESGIFEVGPLGPDDVYFESTRLDKCKRIGQLKCTDFIDDLEEVFLDEAFPDGVARILYDPHGHCAQIPGVRTASSWKEIKAIFFDKGY